MTKATVLERLTVLAKQLQFYWALGHLVTVAMALAHFLSRSKATFNWSLYGTLASYSLIVYKTHAGTLSGPGGMQDKARRLLLDENVQYFLLAGSWALSGKPLSFALVPFATFAAFHLLGFIRSEILAKVWIESASSPSTSSSATEGETPKASLKTRFMSTLGSFLTEYQPKALYLAAVWEVWILTPTILLGLFLRWVSFFTPLAYFQFLRFRYLLSPSTRSVVHEADARIEGWMSHSSLPPWARQGHQTLRGWIISYGDLRQTGAADAPAQ